MWKKSARLATYPNLFLCAINMSGISLLFVYHLTWKYLFLSGCAMLQMQTVTLEGKCNHFKISDFKI